MYVCSLSFCRNGINTRDVSKPESFHDLLPFIQQIVVDQTEVQTLQPSFTLLSDVIGQTTGFPHTIFGFDVIQECLHDLDFVNYSTRVAYAQRQRTGGHDDTDQACLVKSCHVMTNETTPILKEIRGIVLPQTNKTTYRHMLSHCPTKLTRCDTHYSEVQNANDQKHVIFHEHTFGKHHKRCHNGSHGQHSWQTPRRTGPAKSVNCATQHRTLETFHTKLVSAKWYHQGYRIAEDFYAPCLQFVAIRELLWGAPVHHGFDERLWYIINSLSVDSPSSSPENYKNLHMMDEWFQNLLQKPHAHIQTLHYYNSLTKKANWSTGNYQMLPSLLMRQTAPFGAVCIAELLQHYHMKFYSSVLCFCGHKTTIPADNNAIFWQTLVIHDKTHIRSMKCKTNVMTVVRNSVPFVRQLLDLFDNLYDYDVEESEIVFNKEVSTGAHGYVQEQLAEMDALKDEILCRLNETSLCENMVGVVCSYVAVEMPEYLNIDHYWAHGLCNLMNAAQYVHYNPVGVLAMLAFSNVDTQEFDENKDAYTFNYFGYNCQEVAGSGRASYVTSDALDLKWCNFSRCSDGKEYTHL
jgi:hypothetical protein